MKVYLIRHAKTKDSEEGLHQRDDSPIIIKREEILTLKKLKVDKVFSSPLHWAKQTEKSYLVTLK